LFQEKNEGMMGASGNVQAGALQQLRPLCYSRAVKEKGKNGRKRGKCEEPIFK
jgi:hypothetical protein